MNVKSERLKKLEVELKDLQQWMKLGLVPKKDIEKHQTEMEALQQKIEEEKERLRFLKENDELEYAAPKRNQPPRSGFQEAHTIPDVNVDDNMTEGETESGNETFTESETISDDSSDTVTEDVTTSDEDEDDPFSDRNRWKRGILEDPESDDW
ncbi:MAG: hypothetical protein S4CHLAM37_14570 [Chlamydiia bacterium]|nr:hypothetical protein [Chlamydiia bacterium]